MEAAIGINIIVLFAVLGLLIYAICKLKKAKESQLKGQYQIKISCDASQAKESMKEVRAEAERLQKEICDLGSLGDSKKEIARLREVIGNQNCELAAVYKELKLLKNPPKPAKFKVGDRAGDYGIWRVETGFDEPAYRCVNAAGQFTCFRESQIEAMMKLNGNFNESVIVSQGMLPITILKDDKLTPKQKIHLLTILCHIPPEGAKELVNNANPEVK